MQERICTCAWVNNNYDEAACTAVGLKTEARSHLFWGWPQEKMSVTQMGFKKHQPARLSDSVVCSDVAESWSVRLDCNCLTIRQAGRWPFTGSVPPGEAHLWLSMVLCHGCWQLQAEAESTHAYMQKHGWKHTILNRKVNHVTTCDSVVPCSVTVARIAPCS